MLEDANKELARQYIALYNSGQVAIADAIIAPDFVDHTHPEWAPGPEAVKRAVIDLHAAFPDVCVEVERMIAEADTVAFRFVLRGTHSGTVPFAGLPPTGKRISLTGMDFIRVTEGKIAELWSCQDTLGLLRQLGALPTPGSA